MPRYDIVRWTLTHYCAKEELIRLLCIVVAWLPSFPKSLSIGTQQSASFQYSDSELLHLTSLLFPP